MTQPFAPRDLPVKLRACASTQEKVRVTMGAFGGYWRPLAAVARLLEELGELGDEMSGAQGEPDAALGEPDAAPGGPGAMRGGSDAAQHEPGTPQCPPGTTPPPNASIAAELADLWIITTALADQYLAAVAEPGALRGREDAHAEPAHVRNGVSGGRKHAPAHVRNGVSGGREHAPAYVRNGVSGERPDTLANLVSAAGAIARIVNYYDGPKTPRDLHGWISIEQAIARFHQALAAVAERRGVDLEAAVEAKLAAIPKLDSGRFSATWHDPATAPCLEEFRRLPDVANGPLATARLWGGPEWGQESIAEHASLITPSLLSFAKAAPPERLDAYVIAGPPKSLHAACEDWPAQLLRSIAAREPQLSRLTLRFETYTPNSEKADEGHGRRESGEHRAFARLEIARAN